MIGDISNWENFIRNLIKIGYNGFHFAPIQELGFSQSHYSIKNHLKPNQNIFGNSDYSKLKEIFNNIKKEYNCFFLIDIIFNHCSIDSE